MIKKISAIVLALVLCLSVVVMPASAMDLGDALLGYEIKLDKEYYNPGDTAVVSVYVNAAEGYELGTYMFSIGVNSSVFSADDNAATDILATAVGNDTMLTLYKDPTLYTWAWASAAQISAISGSNTAEENEYFDAYIRFSGTRDTASAITNKNGLPTEDLNADDAPFIQFELKVSESVAEGTPVKVAVTSGAISKAQTYFNYYKNPGNATTVAKFAAADSVSFATEATIGQPAPAVSVYAKGSQIRFNNGYAGDANFTFDVRTRAAMTAADFEAICTYDAATKATNIDEVGFIYADSSVGLTLANAKAVVGGASVNGYVKKTVSHIQTTGTEYVWTCLITDADYADAVDSVGYIVVDGTPYFFDAVSSTDFSALYDTYYPQYAA